MQIVMTGRTDTSDGLVFDSLVFKDANDPDDNPIFVTWERVEPLFPGDGTFKIIYEGIHMDMKSITNGMAFDNLILMDVIMDDWVGKPPTYVYVDQITIDGNGYGKVYKDFGAVNGCPECDEEVLV